MKPKGLTLSAQSWYCAAAHLLVACLISAPSLAIDARGNPPRERVLLDTGWSFMRYADDAQADDLIYDVLPDDRSNSWDAIPADTQPTEAVRVESDTFVLKPWILPSGNDFIRDPAKHHLRPEGHPGSDFPFTQPGFDDSTWQRVTIPHDWAIAGPFYEGENPVIGGGMGRLPSHGVAWYRRQLDIPASDAGKRIFLEVEGAMAYAMVWLNGNLVGGWPFGYSTWQLDLTPYALPGGVNQLAIRLDNPPASSRWYVGGGLYRDVWLVKTRPIHVAQWGTQITTPEVSAEKAKVQLSVSVSNSSESSVEVEVNTRIHPWNPETRSLDPSVLSLKSESLTLDPNQTQTVESTGLLKNPKLWHPLPAAAPNLYVAVTEISVGSEVVDRYETRFGLRKLEFDPNRGVVVNDLHIPLRGVNQHHDLGALGAAFNRRAAERQLEILRDMGCNAVRMAHNPPAPELLALCDEMGFLVFNESFDVWERKKTGLGFHLIFPDWHEQDMRALVRRDRNHPSVIIWSTGNEVGEQYTDEEGAAVAARLMTIVNEEDPTRPTSASMNWAKPDMPFSREMDLISLNYQGEGIRQDPIFDGTDRIRTPPMYPAFREAFPDRVIVSSESASALSTRGTYLFPVAPGKTSYIREGIGGDSTKGHVSAYELYAVDFGSSPDLVFEKQDQNPWVAGEFVWSGWDYLGEPTPYYSARSSYCGIIDLAGFPKDRFYLYQARWRPDLPMVHILPHWNWPDRIGEVTPVHVFTSGDEAELFLNGESLGRKQKGAFEYRLRWDDLRYQPGELHVIAYKDGKPWAEARMATTGPLAQIGLTADRSTITADGKDLTFITARMEDEHGRFVAQDISEVTFTIEGPGEIVATDNGDPTDFTPFPSSTRKAFSGLALAIIRSIPGESGKIQVTAAVEGIPTSTVTITTK
jgi:beta-galactosidase